MAEQRESAPTHSNSRAVTKYMNGSHRFRVDGFSLLHGMGPNKLLSSDVFTVAGYDWTIYFYPNGASTDSDEDSVMSVYLALESKETQVTALFDFSLLDQSGNGDHFTKSLGQPHLFDSHDGIWAVWGFGNFFKRSKFLTSKYLKDDCLILLCNVNVLITTNEPPECSSAFIPPANLGHCFKGILDTGMASDIVFKISEKTFKAHKLILAARSQVFHAQFYGPLGNPKTDEIVVDDISPPVFQAMLDFIYSDSLPNLNESTSAIPEQLLVAADHYGLDRLKLFCEGKLCDELTAKTVTSTLWLADQYSCSHLKSSCLKFIASKKNLGEVMKSEGFKNLEKSSPLLLSELLQAIADEP